MRRLSPIVGGMERSGIREVMDLAFGVPGTIRLEVGEPDFPTPAHIVEAGAQALRDGYTRYTPNRGLASLRELLVAKLCDENGIAASVESVVVTAGGMNGIAAVMLALVEPGDHVLVPDPGWPNYVMNVTLAQGRPIAYPLDPSRRYAPDLDRLAALAGHPRAKALVINSPSNPTGAVLAPEVLERLLQIARTNDLFVISDEVYEKIVFEGAHVSLASLDRDERVVSIFSFSKTYAMTGWRVGYAVGPVAVMELVAKLQEALVACAPAVSQKAAEAALVGSQAVVADMVATYRARRTALVHGLAQSRIPAVQPAGGFYVLADVSAFASDTRAFAKWLVQRHGVAVAPGETFGARGAGKVRLSIASDQAALEEGARRLARGALAWPEGGRDGRA